LHPCLESHADSPRQPLSWRRWGTAPSRRIATRYDKLAANFLAAIHLAATVSYWL